MFPLILARLDEFEPDVGQFESVLVTSPQLGWDLVNFSPSNQVMQDKNERISWQQKGEAKYAKSLFLVERVPSFRDDEVAPVLIFGRRLCGS